MMKLISQGARFASVSVAVLIKGEAWFDFMDPFRIIMNIIIDKVKFIN